MKYDLGIRCDYFLSMADGKAEPQRNIFIGITGNTIAHVGPSNEKDSALCNHFIDAKDQVVLPGLINGHTHLPMTLYRGLEDDLPFQEWLFHRILPLEGVLTTADFVRVGAELAAFECIRFGVTTVNDMYYFASTVAEVCENAGLRGRFSQVLADFPLPEDKALGKDKTRLFETLHERYKNHDRIKVGLGPHAPYSCSDETLTAAMHLAQKHHTHIHIHVSETQSEVLDSKNKFGKSPVKRLSDLGVLKTQCICAHGVHVDDQDIQLIKQAKASVVYNPDSNMKLSSGIAPIPKYFAAGIPVALGTDGSASNNDLSLFSAMDVGTKLQKLFNHSNTAMLGEQALRLATYEGARALGLEKEIGSIEVGKKADIITVDLLFPHLQPVYNIVSQLIYSAQGLEVDTTICDGKILMQKKLMTKLDPERIFAQVAQVREKTLKVLHEIKKH